MAGEPGRQDRNFHLQLGSHEYAAMPRFYTGAGDLNSGLDAYTASTSSQPRGIAIYKHISSPLVKLHGGNEPDTLDTLLSRKQMFLGTTEVWIMKMQALPQRF